MRCLLGLCALLAGCYSPSTELPCTVHCDQSLACPGALQCDMNDGMCKLPGGACPTDAGMIDGADAEIDATLDAGMFCYGTMGSLFYACFQTPPTQNWMITGTTSFDTGGAGCDIPQANNGSPICIMYRSSVTIAAGSILRAHGSRALVILANSISVMGTIDASSDPLGVFPQGAGGGWVGCPAPTLAPSDIGGGAGGSFASAGADGGNGNAAGPNGGRHAPVATPTAPHGGCNGQIGNGNGTIQGPFGGGAVLLASNVSIGLSGGITVAGAGGTGGATSAGGAGGGAGGLISIDAPAISPNTGWLLADGGGGGCGGITSTSGLPGRTRTHGSAPTGCANATGGGGDGTRNGINPSDGFDGVAGVGGGGGGGGGGSIRFYGGIVGGGVADRSPPAGAPE